MFYVFDSTDGSLPKEPKGDESSQIAGKTHTRAHTQFLLHLGIPVLSVCLGIAEETCFNYEPATVTHF